MSYEETRRTLDRPVGADDHALGPTDARLTLVEYGSYACPYCRVAQNEIDKVRDEFSTRLRYVFRHRPLQDIELERQAAEFAECTTAFPSGVAVAQSYAVAPETSKKAMALVHLRGQRVAGAAHAPDEVPRRVRAAQQECAFK